MGTSSLAPLTLQCVDCGVEISCDRDSALSILTANFGAMAGPAYHRHLRYQIQSDLEGRSRLTRRDSDFQVGARDMGELIFHLEGDLVVQLQLLRPAYLFLHAAVLEFDGSAHLLVGESGAGKSTTCWGLLHHGFGYLSDELAPVDLDKGSILPYSHALCMKSEPPPGYPLPDGSYETSRGLHVPVTRMPAVSHAQRLPLRSMFMIEPAAARRRPALRELGAAEAAVRLYPNILNALAHQSDGLEAASYLAANARCFQLEAAALRATCDLIAKTVKAL